MKFYRCRGSIKPEDIVHDEFRDHLLHQDKLVEKWNGKVIVRHNHAVAGLLTCAVRPTQGL